MSLSEIPTNTHSFPELLAPSAHHPALRPLGAAAYTLFVTPDHDQLHVDVADLSAADAPLPLHPPINQVIDQVKTSVLPLANATRPPTVSGKNLLRLGSALMQFTDYIPELQDMRTPYEHVQQLRDAVQERAASNGPLTMADQLEVAVRQTDGDVPNALWRLFVTSRLHARWLDGSIINDMPTLTRDERISHMKTWHDSVAAFKEREDGLSQDAGGDTYYAWTHALAKVALTTMPSKQTPVIRVAAHAFHNGTRLMHGIVHTIAQTQGVKSDHTVAAHYGNAVGAAIAADYNAPSSN